MQTYIFLASDGSSWLDPTLSLSGQLASMYEIDEALMF